MNVMRKDEDVKTLGLEGDEIMKLKKKKSRRAKSNVKQ